MRRPVEAEAIGFGDFLQGHRIRPAEVQRDYVWTGVQVAALVDDLIGYLDRKNADIASPGYFIGSFVGYRDADGILRLYDGLQRTTTLTLLICMIRDWLDAEPLADALQDCVSDKDGRYRFEMGGEDETLARHVQPRGATRHWPKTQKVLNRFIVIEEARRTILDAFETHGYTDKGTLTRKGRSMLRGLAVVLTTDLYLVHLNAESQSIALRMFETVNMRGVSMDEVDLIKTRLPGLAASDEEANTLLALWDRLRGRVRFRFHEFVLALNTLHRNPTAEPEAAPFEALTDWMQALRSDHPDALANWLRDQLHYADAWNDLHAVRKPGWMGSPGLATLRPIFVIDWPEWKPYALMLLRLWQKRRAIARRRREPMQAANDWLAGHLDQLQRACMALDIARDEPRRRRAFFYGATRILTGNEAADRFLPPIKPPRQRRIRNTLSGPLEDRQQRLRLLTWLEACRDADAIPALLRDGDAAPTIEHILPQNPPPGSDWFDLFADQVTVRRSRNLLGNLVLIPGALNASMDNSSYAEKRALAVASLRARKGYSIARDAFDEPVWDQAAIDRRTQALGEAIWSALGLPDRPQFITDEAAESDADIDLGE